MRTGQTRAVNDFGLDEPSKIHRDEVRPDTVILDVRNADDWAAGHIAGALHVPLDQLASRMTEEPGELATGNPIVVTCGGGSRAGRAASWLNANGFNAVVLDGGMRGWKNNGRPTVSDTGEPPAAR